MTTETNKALIRRMVEEIQNGGNLELLDELLAPNFVNHTPVPGLSADREGIKHLLRMFRAAFPDGSMTIEDMIAEGEKVVSRKTYQRHAQRRSRETANCAPPGVFTGEFAGATVL